MPDFYKLKVNNIERITEQAVVLSLTVPEANKELFRFRAGQYLTFRHDYKGEELRRSYSICVCEGSSELKVGVKRVTDGAFSNFVCNQLKVDDYLEAMPPLGNFTLDSGYNNTELLVIAAGSGITPILGHIETAFLQSDNVRITLLYGNKTAGTIMFRERLEELKNLYMNRFNVIHVLSASPQDIDIFSGRITAARCLDILHKWVQNTNYDHALICGPEAMIKDITPALAELGMAKSTIKYELFASAGRKTIGKTTIGTTKQADIALSVIIDGTSQQLAMHAGDTVLEAAKRNKLDVPFSCQSGICSTCRCKIIEGAGEMLVNHALEDYEVDQGYALSCQLVPTTTKIAVNYDESH